MDFPRHAGFYIGLWSFLHARTGEPRWLEWSLKMLDHHWRARHPRTGLLPVCSRGDRARTATPEMMLSLAVSLLEAARLLPPGETPSGRAGARFDKAARAYLEAVLRLPHRPEMGKFLTALPIDGDGTGGGEFSEPYLYVYGGGFTADLACLLLAAHRLTGDPRPRALAEATAEFYARHEPPPATEVVRAHVYASILNLFTDLYALGGKPEHLAEAKRHARLALERLQYRGLFRGATAIEHYQADLMPGSLAYGLLRLHALESKSAVEAEPNYFHR
jgi:hypothetical protein